jgi:hypothetical protein
MSDGIFHHGEGLPRGNDLKVRVLGGRCPAGAEHAEEDKSSLHAAFEELRRIRCCETRKFLLKLV